MGRQPPDPVPAVIGLAALLALAVIVHRLHKSVSAETASRRTLRRLCNGHPVDTELIVARIASELLHAL